MMRSFKNIALLIRTKRQNHSKAYSQSELSHLLGYKNGQFISNVERALCNIPLKMLAKVAEILDIPYEELKTAILKDQEETLNNYFNRAAKNRPEIKNVTIPGPQGNKDPSVAANSGDTRIIR